MIKRLFLRLLILVALIMIFQSPSVYAATSGTQANSATSFTGANFSPVINGDSYITGTGKLAKITLYIATTNDANEFPQKADGSVDMSNVAATRKDGQPLFVKFGNAIIGKGDYSLPQTSRVNLETSKLDALIDYKNGAKRAPAYTSTVSNSQLQSLGIPQWLVNGKDNHTAVVSWITDASSKNKTGSEKFYNLSSLIRAVAETASPGAYGNAAVNNVINIAKSKTPFSYKDSDGNPIDVNILNVLPWGTTGTDADSNRGLAAWLVVYEPVIHFAQDPYKLFYGAKGGTHFLMTATDAVLTNMYSGTSGYVSVEKFARNTPTITAHYNYCRICDKTWYGYPGWSKANIPLASLCPTSGCKGASMGVYIGETKYNRQPFMVFAGIRTMSNTFHTSENWLRYSGGHLITKPPASMDTLVKNSANEGEVLLYGGYSVFISAPMAVKSTEDAEREPEPGTAPPAAITTDPNTIAENELIKAIRVTSENGYISKVSAIKTSVDTTCPGYITIPYEYIEKVKQADGTYKDVKKTGWKDVDCGHSHTLDNAYGVTPKSITVKPEWFWKAEMFSGVSKLAVLRNSGPLVNDGKTFVFNTTSAFTSNNMSNAFDQLTEYLFLAHRNGDSQPLQTAAYMSEATINKDFRSFITPYYGNYPSAYGNPTGHFGADSFSVNTSLELHRNASAIGYGAFCSGGSSDTLSIPVRLMGEMLYGITTVGTDYFTTETKVNVQPTVSQNTKSSPSLATQAVYAGLGNPDANAAYYVRFESQPITFFPAFKMSYDTNNSGTSKSEVWMLASGARTFKSYDLVAFEILETKIDVKAPWSRDHEDKYLNPGDNLLIARTIPTAKSGNAFKADASGTTLRVTVQVHLQDPSFVDPAHRVAVQAQNDATIEKYDNIVRDVISKLQGDGLSYYSNLAQATTPETINFIPTGSNSLDNREKSTVRLEQTPVIHTNIITTAAYVDNNSTADAPTGRVITVKGQDIVLKPWADTSIIKSNAVLGDLLVSGGGSTGWYNESYEGIIVVTRTYLLELSNIQSDYAQIHPQLSDSRTERNELARELKFAPDNRYALIPEKQFGIGLEIRFPTVSLGGTTFTPVLCGQPYFFDIRGSVYDTK